MNPRGVVPKTCMIFLYPFNAITVYPISPLRCNSGSAKSLFPRTRSDASTSGAKGLTIRVQLQAGRGLTQVRVGGVISRRDRQRWLSAGVASSRARYWRCGGRSVPRGGSGASVSAFGMSGALPVTRGGRGKTRLYFCQKIRDGMKCVQVNRGFESYLSPFGFLAPTPTPARDGTRAGADRNEITRRHNKFGQ